MEKNIRPSIIADAKEILSVHFNTSKPLESLTKEKIASKSHIYNKKNAVNLANIVHQEYVINREENLFDMVNPNEVSAGLESGIKKSASYHGLEQIKTNDGAIPLYGRKEKVASEDLSELTFKNLPDYGQRNIQPLLSKKASVGLNDLQNQLKVLEYDSEANFKNLKREFRYLKTASMGIDELKEVVKAETPLIDAIYNEVAGDENIEISHNRDFYQPEIDKSVNFIAENYPKLEEQVNQTNIVKNEIQTMKDFKYDIDSYAEVIE